jgi:hypothetical protein
VQVDVSADVGFGAVSAKAFHAGSPLVLLVCYLVPALLAYWQFFAFYLNVQFDVFVFAVVFPRVFTMFHVFSSEGRFSVFCLLRQLLKLPFAAGEG